MEGFIHRHAMEFPEDAYSETAESTESFADPDTVVKLHGTIAPYDEEVKVGAALPTAAVVFYTTPIARCWNMLYDSFIDFFHPYGECLCWATFFLLGFFAFLIPYFMENNRSCAYFAPGGGIFSNLNSKLFVNDVLDPAEVIAEAFVMKAEGIAHQTLYVRENGQVVPLGEFRGKLGKSIKFFEFDSLCNKSIDNNSNEVASFGTKFCVLPTSDTVKYTKGGGPDPFFSLFSPFIPDLEIGFYTHAKDIDHRIYPKAIFSVSVKGDNRTHTTELLYNSYPRRSGYLIRANFDYEEHFNTLWLGAGTFHARVGNYGSKLPYDSHRFNRKGQLYRICVPAIDATFQETEQNETAYERLFENVENLVSEAKTLMETESDEGSFDTELNEIMVEIFESVLLSKYVSAKVMFQIYGVGIFKGKRSYN